MKLVMKNIRLFTRFSGLLFMIITMTQACADYLDVVPDNIATIDNAFTNRTMAEKFLFTCYSHMPKHANPETQVFLAGDEFWMPYPQYVISSTVFENLARGNQNVTEPTLNYWDGMFKALRDCNTFLEKIHEVPGMLQQEQERWIAEVKFLKAYYHYWLLRMYGPIPLIRTNLPVSASIEEVQVQREPVDDCFDYIVSLLNEAIFDLPLKLQNETTETGRATKAVALAIKAKILVEAASPLFNGNTDYASFKRKVDGVQYFNQTFDVNKWEKAAIACKNAIDTCHLAGFHLYEYRPIIGENMVPEIITQMSIRNSICDNNYNYNKEVVWMNPNSTSDLLQRWSTTFLDPANTANESTRSLLAPPLKIAEMFYTQNGIPIDEDEEWVKTGKYAERYKVKKATKADKYHIKEGSETAILNFEREIRFYANLGFDTGLWYGIGRFDINNQWDVRGKKSQAAGKRLPSFFSTTGYYCKKLAHFQNVILPGAGAQYNVVDYPWPVMRLADLYLLYAEALNEASGPSTEVFNYIDKVRERAGLEPVEIAWPTYAKASMKNKHTTKEGFRSIVQQERLIELANEGHRYWEIRRWKLAKEMWHNQPIQGWDIDQEETNTYYRIKTIYTTSFNTKDYLWPIKEFNLSVNPNLDQNPGW